ncbi:hypothetical protein [Amycolatopsis jiangsuensis]|uniref:Uncharacterized protein n=1 Tax=Amycolatopsis jiangsuensis TaxID=1181879 RepID=A0A840J3W6_9PSEU|nr:hypothetical protein [Amycolatopsis jiangsuensis]MBB4688419.1 hypothetical protein [Amycolatopsis jiangsuensis]
MAVRTRAENEVSVWLTGEFAGKLPAPVVEEVVRATGLALDGRIVPDEAGELLYRMARARLQRLLAG